MSASKLIPVAVLEESSYAADGWIPGSKDLSDIYHNLRHSSPDLKAFHVLFKDRKIGQKTFSEGHFDGILLRACRVGNIEIVSSLLKAFTKYFSIDTLIVSLSLDSTHLGNRRSLVHINRAKTRFDGLVSDKVSLLHSAAEGSMLDVVKLLLSLGAEVNNPSSWSITPLISALLFSDSVLQLSRERTLACLIDSGASVQYRDADGLTPLMYAAKSGCVHLVQILLKAGAYPYAVDKEGCTALHYACLFKRTAVAKHLLRTAPRLSLLRGEHSSSYVAPYLTTFHMQLNAPFWISARRSADQSAMCLFLDNPNCPPEIKIDLKLLRVVSQVLFHSPLSGGSLDVDRMVQLVESALAMRIDSNLGAPVSNPIPAYGNHPELAVIEEIKSLDPASPLRQQQLVLQSLVTAERCFGYASIPIMQMLSACLDGLKRKDLSKISLALALRLSGMLLFRLQNFLCLTQISWHEVIRMSLRIVNVAALDTTLVLLDTAINIFVALAHSQQRVSASCMYRMHTSLYSSSQVIFDSLASVDISDEITHMITKFMSNSLLLVNQSTGYPESLLYIALSRSTRPSLPVLHTLLKCGGHRWINTPGGFGCFPLHLGGTKEIASLLVDHGAHLDAVDAGGLIPNYSNEYYESHPRPLSCIVANFIVKTGGILEQQVGLLPIHVQAFVSLHDGHATRLQMDRQAAESC